MSNNAQGKKIFSCLYCGSKYQGGGINRMKYHLACIRGNIAACKKVPDDVRKQMAGFLTSSKQKEKDSFDDAYEEVEEDDVQEFNPLMKSQQKTTTIEKSLGKRKAKDSIEKFMVPRTTPESQPGIKSAFANKQAIQKAHMAFARWFYDSCIPFNALKSPYFQVALDAIAGIGSGYKGPSYNDMRIHLLKNCKKECQLLVDNFRSNWASSGCTIMGDGWSDQRQRTLINFLVYCPNGISFIKSVDASDMVKDATNLMNLFSEIVEWVGPSNVVHLVTDNASNYVAAGM